jgi:hypothetical protein
VGITVVILQIIVRMIIGIFDFLIRLVRFRLSADFILCCFST